MEKKKIEKKIQKGEEKEMMMMIIIIMIKIIMLMIEMEEKKREKEGKIERILRRRRWRTVNRDGPAMIRR